DVFGVRIAVVARIAEQRAVAAEQGEIHAPGVHADARQFAMLDGRLAQRGEHFAPEPQHVPVHRAERLHRTVGEAMHHVQAEPGAVERGHQTAAALGAEVEGEDLGRRWHGARLVVYFSFLSPTSFGTTLRMPSMAASFSSPLRNAKLATTRCLTESSTVTSAS